MSRQRLYQLRHLQLGLCVECPAPATTQQHCELHRVMNAMKCRDRYRRAHHVRGHATGTPRRYDTVAAIPTKRVAAYLGVA